MKYNMLVMGGFAIAMSLAWIFEGRKLFSPPVKDEAVFVAGSGVLDGFNVDEGEGKMQSFSKGQAKSHITPLSDRP
ncbi:uncharacterized protein N7458_000664 [Penicillium daleae]|jgi:hypothetical protein|uniref:Uncharacterized protein n=1 Tax=Penicillium daleae TaxID=63821 RepID=A0AAD6CH26_9EURO|nr:uncharacterized protein N7458_000664 [Penicillium daleae]KAJ5464978.1 hypothetical protein N7458_000664 [Penicillium daleae]